MKQQIAIITLGDTRKDFFYKRIRIVEDENKKLSLALAKDYDLYCPEPVFTMQESAREAQIIKEKSIASVIIHVPIWGTPSLATPIAFGTDLPVLVLGNTRPDSSSVGVFLAVVGTLEQAGKSIVKVLGDVNDVKTLETIKAYAGACKLSMMLPQKSFGLIGGRSIGIGTTVIDPAQWLQKWHIDCDHVDQLALVQKAHTIDGNLIKQYRSWLNNWGGLQFGGKFTEETLEKQIRSYLAMKEIIREKGYNFIALKCQQEMSDGYALQCLTISLLNNTFDAEGAKEVIPCSCEGDCDGALTMLMLHILDEKQPSCLVDIRHYDQTTKEFTFANCGGMGLAYASLDRKEAITKTLMMQHVFGEAGGGAVQFMTHSGDITAARLFRKNGKYCMGMFEGTSIEHTRDTLTSNFCYPHAFIRTDIDINFFIQNTGSNHMHFIFGKHARELQLYCMHNDIQFINYNTASISTHVYNAING